ncbi:glycosyltransferase involved in cell wall biosynthesis [Kineothrix alysoides]|uniref:Glycosyltransferase involved in cell wall biosynthesis n=1 Tax=Kineothrix alysoides TaxID=1469948 RepID=A0A4R1R586_9FIRM|nr:glycosyltransferase family 2 protein [Kineothrix alysoides]TCL60600.1 glycosyltransferase involved in cell wall biosynthesis [Kineothrix alysoides]
MKLLTIAIPCYNSEGYMRKCVESLLVGGEDVEIIIVDDGSKDGTAAIADEYAGKYPSIVHAVHKENGGHGSAVNTGIENASGLFFKVVDSDDWVKESDYIQILDTLRDLTGGEKVLDMLISNFVYEKEGEKRNKVMRYHHALPQNEMFTWDDVRYFRKGQYILMHSVIFRTKLLKDCGLKLPEHTFYVDNLYVFEPLPFVKNMYYLDVNFYRYYIGREGQSVNETIMISRIDQQIKVNKIMVDYMAENKAKIKANRKMKKYMFNYLEIITTISSILLIRGGSEEHLEKKKELWDYIRQKDRMLYTKLRYGILGSSMNLPGKGGRKISVEGYRICQRFFKFN